MKSTGMVRNVDELGRIVIPIELRRNLDIESRDPIEIFVDEDKIVLKKYTSRNACMITGEVSEDNFQFANGKLILSRSGLEMLLKDLEALHVAR